MLQKICKIFNKDPSKYIKYTKDRLYNDKRYSVSSKKIRKLGWNPNTKFDKRPPLYC